MSAAPLVLAVPNISEGVHHDLVERIARPADNRTKLLDVHTDADHNRAVLTYAGPPEALGAECVAMVERAATSLDLRSHRGVHPRFGVVDVLPFVAYRATDGDTLLAADVAARGIGDQLAIPVYRYGRDRPLPDLRRALRSGDPPSPDAGPDRPHPTAGVVAVGIRGPLVAFNVDLRGPLTEALAIAAAVRGPDIRALGFELAGRGLVQVSMNLVDPSRTGPREAFDRVCELARERSLEVTAAEVVGLLPDEIDVEGLPLRAPARTIARALASKPPR